MLTPRSQAYTPGTRSGQAKGSRLHTLHYNENRPLSSPECSKVGFPQDALNWQNGKAVGGSVVVLVAVTGPFFLALPPTLMWFTRMGIDGMLRFQCSKRWLTGRWR